MISPYVRRLRLADEVRSLRQDAELTQEHLGRRISKSRADISRLESGHTVDLADVISILEALRSWRVFPGEASQLRVLRRWLEDLLPPCDALDDVRVVACELGANAVRHTASGQGGQFAVEIAWTADLVRVIVADQGGPSEPRIIKAPEGEHGRGLLAVRELSADSGFSGDENGRLVWADVPWAANDGTRPQESGWNHAAAAGLETLQARYPQVPAWFGQATRQWWVMITIGEEDRLIGASSPGELTALLAAVHPRHRTAGGYALAPSPAPVRQARPSRPGPPR